MNRNFKKILYIIVLIVLSLNLGSCSLKPVKPSTDSAVNKIEEDLKKFFSSIKSGDLTTASLYLDKNQKGFNNELKFNSETEEKVVKEILARIDYKVVATSCNSGKGEAVIEITTPDMCSIYNDMMSKFMGPIISKYMNGCEKDKMEAKNEAKKIGMKYVSDVLSGSYPRTTNKAKIKLIEREGTWSIKMNDDFIFALTGRMPQLLEKAEGKF